MKLKKKEVVLEWKCRHTSTHKISPLRIEIEREFATKVRCWECSRKPSL